MVNLNFHAIVHRDAIYFKDSINPWLPLISQGCYIKRVYAFWVLGTGLHFLPWISTERPAVGLRISQRPQNPGCSCPSEPHECCTLPGQPWEHSPYIQPFCRAVTPPAPGWMGRHRQALGLLFFTLRKNAGEGGEEGSKFLSLFYHSCLSKRKQRELWPGQAACELGAALAEAGWGHAWEWEYVP